MCGRVVVSDLRKLIDNTELLRSIRKPIPDFPASYNIGPMAVLPIVRRGEDGLEVTLTRWGLVPSWAKDPAMGSKTFNARSETVGEKPSFRAAFKRRRCLVPVSGFYEWQAQPKGPKVPFYIHPSEGTAWTLAGLWEDWEGPDGALETSTILTTEANAFMAPIHDRMPVILGPEAAEAWLDPKTPPVDLAGILRPCPVEWMAAHEVGRAVGNVRNQGAGLVQPV